MYEQGAPSKAITQEGSIQRVETRTSNLLGIETLCNHAEIQLENPKAHLELNQARDFKGNKKGFYKYIGEISQARKNVSPVLNGAVALVIQDMVKTEVPYAAFASVFTSKTGLQESQAQRPGGKGWNKEKCVLGRRGSAQGILKQTRHA